MRRALFFSFKLIEWKVASMGGGRCEWEGGGDEGGGGGHLTANWKSIRAVGNWWERSWTRLQQAPPLQPSSLLSFFTWGGGPERGDTDGRKMKRKKDKTKYKPKKKKDKNISRKLLIARTPSPNGVTRGHCDVTTPPHTGHHGLPAWPVRLQHCCHVHTRETLATRIVCVVVWFVPTEPTK